MHRLAKMLDLNQLNGLSSSSKSCMELIETIIPTDYDYLSLKNK